MALVVEAKFRTKCAAAGCREAATHMLGGDRAGVGDGFCAKHFEGIVREGMAALGIKEAGGSYVCKKCGAEFAKPDGLAEYRAHVLRCGAGPDG
jgi:hypothetical protein